jgi:hypothetical protein
MGIILMLRFYLIILKHPKYRLSGHCMIAGHLQVIALTLIMLIVSDGKQDVIAVLIKKHTLQAGLWIIQN